MNTTAFDHPSEALTDDLTHDARVAVEDLGMAADAAAQTVVMDSDFVPETMTAHYIEAVTGNLTAESEADE